MKFVFFGLLSLFLVETCSSFTSATIVEEILESVKSIESLMRDSCRPNLCCSSYRSRSKKGFGGGRIPYDFSDYSTMKSMTSQVMNSDRLKYIEQNISRLQKMKSKLEAVDQLQRNKENQAAMIKGVALRPGSMSLKGSGLSEQSKILSLKKSTNVNTNVNSNAILSGKKGLEKKLRSPLPPINPGILSAPPVPKLKKSVAKKADKNVNANMNTNVNTVNRLMDYDLFDI